MFEYDAQSIYDMKDLSVDSWDNLVNELFVNETLWNTFYEVYFKKYVKRPSCTEGKCRTFIICNLKYAAQNAETNCTQSTV